MELANKGCLSRVSLLSLSLCKKNKLSNVILIWRQTAISMVVAERQHNSLDSPDVHRQTEDRGQAPQQRLSAPHRSQPLICMPEVFSAEFSGWELQPGGQIWAQQKHHLTHLYPHVHHYGKHERLCQYWQHSSGRRDFGKKADRDRL